MLLLLEHVQCLRENGSNRAPAHLYSQVLAICLVSAPTKSQQLAPKVTHRLKLPWNLCIVYANTRYHTPRPEQLEAHLQSRAHANNLYPSLIVSKISWLLKRNLLPITTSAPRPSVSSFTRLSRSSLCVWKFHGSAPKDLASSKRDSIPSTASKCFGL